MAGEGAAAKEKTATRHERRKASIADTAAKLFAEHGFHATSIQDISDATGLQRGALYHYIDSKKDLLYRIHERFIEPLLDEAQAIETRNEPAPETLRALAHALMRTVHSYRDQVTVFLHEWKTIKDDATWEGVRASRRAFEDIFERVIKRGINEGTLNIDDTRLATLAFLGMINYSYQWFDPSGRLDPDTVADHFTNVFLHGVASRDNITEQILTDNGSLVHTRASEVIKETARDR